MKLSIILPVKNQEENIKKNFASICNYLDKYDSEIIVVESNSTDSSLPLLEELNKKYKFILYTTTGKGEGKAIKEGVRIASGDIIGYFDMDLSVPLKFIDDVVRRFESSDDDIVVGNKYLKQSKAQRTMVRLVVSRVFNGILRVVFNSRVGDHACGFKFYKASFIKTSILQVKDDRSFFDDEMLLLAQAKNAKIYELPVEFYESGQTTLRFNDILYILQKIIELRLRINQYKDWMK